MSIATEQKVEELLKRVADLECAVSELRNLVERLTKEAHGARPNKR